MVTLVERFSRHTLLAALPDSYDAANTTKTITQALARKTFTYDVHPHLRPPQRNNPVG